MNTSGGIRSDDLYRWQEEDAEYWDKAERFERCPSGHSPPRPHVHVPDVQRKVHVPGPFCRWAAVRTIVDGYTECVDMAAVWWGVWTWRGRDNMLPYAFVKHGGRWFGPVHFERTGQNGEWVFDPFRSQWARWQDTVRGELKQGE